MKALKLALLPALCVVLLGACASAEHSSSARPVLYPNAAYNNLGQARAQTAIDACISNARQQGLSPSNNAVSEKAGKGAAVTGVMSAVGALVTGRNGDAAVRAGVRGAAVGAAGGAVDGAYDSQANPIYRRYVETCLSERGLSVMGWQ